MILPIMTNFSTVHCWNHPIPSRVIITHPYHLPARPQNRVIIIRLIIKNVLINPFKAIIHLIILINLLFIPFLYTYHFIKSTCFFVF